MVSRPADTAFYHVVHPSCCAISLRLRLIPLLYCITEVRLITFRSLIFARFESNSSWMPAAKNAFSFSSLRFSSGRTAILLSGRDGAAFELAALELASDLDSR